MKFLLSPRILLPMTVVVGILVMGMRMADMWDAVASGRVTLNPAQAEDGVKPGAPPAPDPAKADAPAEAAKPDTKTDTAKPEVAPDRPTLPPPATDPDSSAAEMEVLKQLAERRETLEQRARDLDTREDLMKVTEQRVDQKIKDMQVLKQQLQEMVNQGNEAQQAQIDNLVKIYETMKPDDAARIFEKLDMPVLLGVIQKMKPKSTAPIMAKMAPEKAKEITDALTKQDQLPQIK